MMGEDQTQSTEEERSLSTADVEKLLDFDDSDLNTGQREVVEIARRVVKREQVVVHSGPLPAGSELLLYEQACPGAADRVIKMAETQTIHRTEMERKTLDATIEASADERSKEFIAGLVGAVFALIICLSTIAVGGFCIYTGHEISGFFSVFAGLASVLGVFIYRKKQSQEKHDDEENAQ